MTLTQAERDYLYAALIALPVPRDPREQALHYSLCARFARDLFTGRPMRETRPEPTPSL